MGKQSGLCVSVKETMALYEELRQKEGIPVRTYNQLLFLLEFQYEKAKELFINMQKEVEPTAETYNAMIRCAVASSGKSYNPESLRYFEKMKELGLSPCRFTYDELIRSSAHEHLSLAMSLYDEMIRSNITPCTTTITHLIAVCKSRDFTNKVKELEEFLHSGSFNNN